MSSVSLHQSRPTGVFRVQKPVSLSVRRLRVCRRLKRMTKNSTTRVVFALLLGGLISFTFSVWTSHLVRFPTIPCERGLKTQVNNVVGNVRTRTKWLRDELNAKGFLFVSVMTSSMYIGTRARGVWDTWGRDVPGRLIFFTGKINITNDVADLPVIQLNVPDDIYPPQTKSFRMIEYVSMHFADDYEWLIKSGRRCVHTTTKTT